MSAKGSKRETIVEKWSLPVKEKHLVRSQLVRSSSRSPDKAKTETNRNVMKKSASLLERKTEENRLAGVATTRRRRVISKSPIARRAGRTMGRKIDV